MDSDEPSVKDKQKSAAPGKIAGFFWYWKKVTGVVVFFASITLNFCQLANYKSETKNSKAQAALARESTRKAREEIEQLKHADSARSERSALEWGKLIGATTDIEQRIWFLYWTSQFALDGAIRNAAKEEYVQIKNSKELEIRKQEIVQNSNTASGRVAIGREIARIDKAQTAFTKIGPVLGF
jgi:hypothetical protein